jgi:adenylate cyclase
MTVEEEWRAYLMGNHPDILRGRRMFGWMPSGPRCRLCQSPFHGLGALLVGRMGIRPWEKNPNLCRRCVTTMASRGPSGAEIELTLLFADIRGSTTIGEGMSSEDFSALMNRFYQAASRALIAHDALIDKFVGDEVIGLFIPGIAGENHAARAISAARGILDATGHGSPEGPWLPVGIGVYTGVARVGLVGNPRGVMDFTALGDTVNTTARLSSAAGTAEIVVGAASVTAAGAIEGIGEERQLQVKGRQEPVAARVIRVGDAPASV